MNIVYLPNALEISSAQTLPAEPGITFGQWLAASGWDKRLADEALLVQRNGEPVTADQFGLVLDARDTWAISREPLGDPVTWAIVIIATVATVAAVSMMTPGMPEYGNHGNDMPAGSPTYNLATRSNRARLGEPKPVLYGKMRTFPDLASSAYTEYVGNEQHLYQLFEITQGQAEVDLATARFEDTPLSSFNDYEAEVIPPGGTPTIYPYQVITSGEVANLQLEDTTLGPYTANGQGTRATRLAVDIIAPRGIYRQDDKGVLRTFNVRVIIEALEVDDNDAPIGDWFRLGSEALSGDNPTAIRESFDYTVPPGRYQVRIYRTRDRRGNVRFADDITWGALRAYLEDATDVTDTTRVALRIRASNTLPNGVAQKFNVVSQRLLPVWNSSTGWSAPQATRSAAWAFADAARSSYGGNRPDSQLDLYELESLAATLAADGLNCDCIFDRKGNLWEALTRIAQTAMAVPIDQMGVYRMVRDAQQGAPVQVFGMRNILRGSFGIEHVGVLDDTSDGVVAEYFDAAEDYRMLTVPCVLDGDAGDNPRRVKLFGVTDRTQAYRIGLYLAASNRYRRRLLSFETGREAEILGYGDQIMVSHHLLGVEGQDQVSGDVFGWDGVDVLTLSERVDQLANPYLVLRDSQGAPSQVYACAVVGRDRLRVLDLFDATVLDFDPSRERIQFVAGESASFSTLAKVTRLEGNGDGRYKVEAFTDDDRVYTAAQGVQPPAVGSLNPLPSAAPVVTGLGASVEGTLTEPVVTLGWQANNADRFRVEFSDDGGVSWQLIHSDLTALRLEHRPEAGSLVYRVAGINLLRGAWVTVSVDTTSTVTLPPPPISALQVVGSFTGPELELSWTSTVDEHLVEFLRGGVVRLSARAKGTGYKLSGTLAYQHGLGRAFDVRVTSLNRHGTPSETPVTISVSNPAPPAPNNVQVNPVVDGFYITLDMPTDSDIRELRVWGSTVSGFGIGDSTFLGASSRAAITLAGDQRLYLKFAFVDVWDDALVGLNYTGEFVADPALVGASKISVASLAAISANLGTVTAGTFKTDPLTGNRVEISAEGTWPIWVGSGDKTEANAKLYYDKFLNLLRFRGALEAATGTFAGQLQAATGTFSGSLTANAINAVNTINIAGEALTVPLSAFTRDNATLTTTLQKVQELVVPAAPSGETYAVDVEFSFRVGASASANDTIYFEFRSSTWADTLMEAGPVGPYADGHGVVSASRKLEVSSSASATISLWVRRAGTYASLSCGYRYIGATVTKR